MTKVEMNKTQLSSIFASLTAMKNVALGADENLTGPAAKEYCLLLKENIYSQKFASDFTPLVPKWKKQKAKGMYKGAPLVGGGHPNEFWRFTDTLVKAIHWNKISKDKWWVGIEQRGGGEDHENPKYYAPIIEKKRPEFRLTFEEFKPDWNARVSGFYQKLTGCW